MQKLVDYYSERHKVYESHFRYLNENEKVEIEEQLNSISDMACLEDMVGEPEYNAQYYIEFKNPFCNRNKFSKITNDILQLESEETIKCIGIADKLGKIYLHGVWEDSEPAYIEYKQANEKTNKYGKMYSVTEGWCLTRQCVEGYKVKKIYKNKKPCYITETKMFHGVNGVAISDISIKKL